MNKETIKGLLESSCEIEGYQELSWRDFLKLALRELIYRGQDFKGTCLTGDDEWQWRLMDAIAELDPSLDPIEGRHYAAIFQEGGWLDQILDKVFEEKLAPNEWLRQSGRTIVFSVKGRSNEVIVEQMVSAKIANVVLLSLEEDEAFVYFQSPAQLIGVEGITLEMVRVNMNQGELYTSEGNSRTGYPYDVECQLIEIY